MSDAKPDKASLNPTVIWLCVLAVALASFSVGTFVGVYAILPKTSSPEPLRTGNAAPDNGSSAASSQPTRTHDKSSTAQTGEVIWWRDAAEHYGKECTVEGTIVLTRNTGKACFLNFSNDYKTDFTAVIFASRFKNFPPSPEEYYRDKAVRVIGTVKQYQGKPEIVLDSPSQIKILNASAEDSSERK